MKVDNLQFGRITIDGRSYNEDIVIDNDQITLRDKTASRKKKSVYGHTPLTLQENIPWNCKRLVIGSGQYGSLPVEKDIHRKAAELGVQLFIEPTPQAIQRLNEPDTNFVLHLTC